MRIVTFAFISLFSIPVFADCFGHLCNPVKITRLVLSGSGDISVGTSGDETKLSCDAGKGIYIVLRKEHANFQAIYSLFLTAQTTEHPISIRTTESGVCEVNYVVSDK